VKAGGGESGGGVAHEAVVEGPAAERVRVVVCCQSLYYRWKSGLGCRGGRRGKEEEARMWILTPGQGRVWREGAYPVAGIAAGEFGIPASVGLIRI